ncbi:thiol reductant ABC exporter subunit CydD [Bacillus sp. EB106-08-02-XG196]|jgi:ATP-binding cassette, subfamily C, bacterial CydD|uniref:thiol reductant ABC exporter subunit CydD n=1 Tax=Bacillus sp. EB106-08-02-XG196 TaxID=2737049 RepID=UPI0015C49F09|nr:thiol reductant ABC exporter subunit CydD [Bacillus sp. EB106-08-02-XG196]NWQ42220.1 thiol reductant ABC exporter subunit CydD [Bacillus sp. EB106-08-02-XG196]
MDRKMISYQGAKTVLSLLAILTAIQAAAIITQAYYLAEAISSLFGGDLFRTVIKDLLIFFISLIVRQVTTVVKKNIAYDFAAKTSKNFRERLLEKVFQLGPRFTQEEGSGQTVTLVMEGITKFRRYLELYFPKIMNAAFIPGILVLYIFFENSRSGLILVLTFPIVMIFMVLLGKAAIGKALSQYESYQLLSNHFVDSLRGLETLKYLGLSVKHIEKIAWVSEQYRKATIAALRIAFLSSFALDFFTMLSIATVAVFLGLGLINGSMELHSALTILMLAPEYFLPIREVGADYHATLDGKNAGNKIQEILDLDSSLPKQEPLSLWESTSTLTVSGMSIEYSKGEKPGLRDIKFTLSGSKRIGIVGASGSGKSTMIDVLSGFLNPSRGEFLISGKKVTSLCQRDWQKQITYIPQQPYIFHDTIMNNIRFYHPEATFEEVEAATEKSGLKAMVDELPQGLENQIGEGGRRISGGQEQRIAIARSFLGNTPIIMLDEPTAHLDIETEAELKETMLQLFEGKLVFFATHRLHWMLDMDQILVLDQGELVETGTHDELLAKRGYYYQLVSTKMEGNL